jgi:hypothetical protein
MYRIKKTKAIIQLFIIVLVFFSITTGVQAYDMPIGIPDVWIDPDITAPERPADWSSEIEGYYYVEDTAGCSTSLNYGYEGNPRCYLPNPIPAGSYIEVHGEYNHTVAGTIQIHGTGTADNPIWIVGENIDERPTFTDQVLVFGSYIYIDNVKSYVTGANDTCFIFGTGSHSGYKADHCMIRNSEMMSDSGDRAHAVSIAGYNESEAAEYIIIANNHMHNFGILFPQPDHDVDAHVVTVNKESRHVWLLDNTIHDAGGAGIAIGQEGPSWHYTDNQWIFAGRNYVYNTLQANMSIKGAWHVVFSENNVHDPITRWADGILKGTVASPAKCFGWKGEPQDYWIINNTCQNASYGIHGGATVDNQQFKIYILNNTFRHIYANKPEEFTGTNTWGEAAISMIRGGYVYAIGNSIYDAVAGITAAGPGGESALLYNYYIENNIIDNIGYAHMVIGSRDNPSQTHVRNNIIYQPDNSSELIRWGSNDYSGDLEGWKVASGEGENVVITNPNYFNPDGNDFHIQSASPAINAALSDTELATNVYDTFQNIYGLDIRRDRNGLVRPQGPGWDIGAFEYDMNYTSINPNNYDGNKDACIDSGYIYCELNNRCGTTSCCGYNPSYCNNQIDCENYGWTYNNNNGECVTSDVVRADVDNNSTINTTDAMLTLRNSLGLSMSGTNWYSSSTTGDVNCDGNSNSTDAMLILRHSLGLDMSGTGWCE